MALQNHINRLVDEYKALDKEIEHLEASGTYDDIALSALKKKKLQLKDEIAKVRQHKANVAKIRKAAGE